MGQISLTLSFVIINLINGRQARSAGNYSRTEKKEEFMFNALNSSLFF